jgi:hypothetical protein
MSKTILYPVPDNGWFPIFRCGEFAIVDTADRVPASDIFMLRRLRSGGSLSIVKLRPPSAKLGTIIDRGTGKVSSETHWMIVYCARPVLGIDERPQSTAGEARVHFADGPLAEKLLREEIVGRVVGVQGRTLEP